MKIAYFVSYATVRGFGNCQINHPEIKSIDDIRALARLIEQTNEVEGVVILFFREF